MPFGEYTDFDDCLSKNSDKDDPSAYCGYIKNQVEEALKRKEAREAISKAIEQDPNANEPEGLTTPDAGNQNEEQVQDLTSPQGSSREADNDQASGDGELSPADPPQDQAEPEANSQDQAKPADENERDGEIGHDWYKKPEDEFKDEKREEHQSLEYNGETYHKVNAIEFDDEIYTQKDDKEEAGKDDIEFEDNDYGKADDDVLELDDDFYVKDNEQAPMSGGDIGQPAPTTAIDVPELNPTMESVVIRESNGRYRKYNVFEADNPTQTGNTDDYEVDVDELIKTGEPTQKLPTDRRSYDTKASDEVRAVEKIIIKEKGRLKFKSVFTEVKKKASKMTQ